MRNEMNTGVAHLRRGPSRPTLELKEIEDILRGELGDAVPETKDLPGDPFVELTTAVPHVAGKGWINLIGGWNYWSEPGNGAWWNGPPSAGRLEIWLDSLTPNHTYVVAIDTMCYTIGDPATFEVRSSASQAQWVGAQPPEQTLLLMMQVDGPMALVSVEPHNLGAWKFDRGRVFDLG